MIKFRGYGMMKERTGKTAIGFIAVFFCILAGLTALGSTVSVGGECDVEGDETIFGLQPIVCIDGRWEAKPSANSITPVDRIRLVPNIVKSDEECEIVDVWDTGFRLECNHSFNDIVKEKPANSNVVFRPAQEKFEAEVTYSELTLGMEFELGANSTQINVTEDTDHGHCRCFNPGGGDSCSDPYVCYTDSQQYTIEGYDSDDYYIGINLFNVSELKGETLSDANFTQKLYDGDYGGTDPRDDSLLYIAFCASDCTDPAADSDIEDFDKCGSFASFLSYTGGDDISGMSNNDWYSHSITSELQDAVDSLGTDDCLVVVNKYNWSLLSNNDASRFYGGSHGTSSNHPYITYDLGSTTTTTTTTSTTTTTTSPTTTIADVYVNESGDTMTGPLNMSTNDIQNVGTIDILTGFSCADCVEDSAVKDDLTLSSSASVAWAALTSYPTDCSSGQFVRGVGDTLTCYSDATNDDVDSSELDNLCSTDNKILKRVSGTWQCTDDQDTTLSQEQVEDYVGGMVDGNTETHIAVTYQDADGTLDFVVSDDWIDEAGDTLSGALNMDGNDITGIDELKSTGNMHIEANGGDGIVNISGTVRLHGKCKIEGEACEGDIAELMHSKASAEAGLSDEFESGDVVCISTDLRTIEYCDSAYDSEVLSVVNYDASQYLGVNAPYPVSLKGIVPVKVDCITPIKVGDLLVTSEKPGYAQNLKTQTPSSFEEVWDMMGSPFAKALESCDSGEAVIKAWLI